MPHLDSQPGLPALPVVYRPRAARITSYAVGVLVLAGALILAVALPGPTSAFIDRVGIVAFGLVIAWFCHRQASVCVAANEAGVRVRNLFVTREFEWAQLVQVSFPQGDPWAHLDLASGDTVAAMAFQRADAARGVAAAREFNALIGKLSVPTGAGETRA